MAAAKDFGEFFLLIFLQVLTKEGAFLLCPMFLSYSGQNPARAQHVKKIKNKKRISRYTSNLAAGSQIQHVQTGLLPEKFVMQKLQLLGDCIRTILLPPFGVRFGGNKGKKNSFAHNFHTHSQL